MVLLILLVIATTGFLQGVGVGLVAAVILFAISYSRSNVIKGEFTCEVLRSRVNRPLWQREQLQQRGEQLQVLQLQGYIFFGTAHALLERIERQTATANQIRFLLLDFRQVTGLDATALMRFETLAQLTSHQDITLILTHLAPPVARQIANSGIVQQHGKFRILPTLDAGLEWAEEQLLDETTGPAVPGNLANQLATLQGERNGVDELIRYLERRELPSGHHLIHQGAPADDLYFLEQGQVTAQLERDGEPPLRLETMRGGTVVGELAFFGLGVRTASVVIDEPSVLYRLTREAMREMELHSPEGTACFYRVASRLLSARAVHLLRVVDALQK